VRVPVIYSSQYFMTNRGNVITIDFSLRGKRFQNYESSYQTIAVILSFRCVSERKCQQLKLLVKSVYVQLFMVSFPSIMHYNGNLTVFVQVK
jgi:hypothetical protein